MQQGQPLFDDKPRHQSNLFTFRLLDGESVVAAWIVAAFVEINRSHQVFYYPNQKNPPGGNLGRIFTNML
jgi:hypothetical protein